MLRLLPVEGVDVAGSGVTEDHERAVGGGCKPRGVLPDHDNILHVRNPFQVEVAQPDAVRVVNTWLPRRAAPADYSAAAAVQRYLALYRELARMEADGEIKRSGGTIIVRRAREC